MRLYRDNFRPSPAHAKPYAILATHVVCADSDEEAREHMRKGLEYFHHILMRPQRSAQQLVIQKTRYYQKEGSADRFQARLATLRGRSLIATYLTPPPHSAYRSGDVLFRLTIHGNELQGKYLIRPTDAATVVPPPARSV